MAGIASIIASMAANLIVRSIGIRVADVPGGFEPLASAGPVVMASIAYGVIATIAFIITRYFASNLRRTWLIVGAVGLIASSIPPLSLLSQDDSSGAGVVILLIMHLAAAAIFIPTMLRVAGDE
jgi:hypothetical protein